MTAGSEKDEHRTSNIEHRILNKVFCQFINWRSDPPASPEGEADGGQERHHYSMLDVQCSMLDVHISAASSPALLNFCYAKRRSRFNRVNHCGVLSVRLSPQDSHALHMNFLLCRQVLRVPIISVTFGILFLIRNASIPLIISTVAFGLIKLAVPT